MAGLLIVLVFVNVGVTGWLVASVIGMRRTVRHLGNVQRDVVSTIANDFHASESLEDDSEV